MKIFSWMQSKLNAKQVARKPNNVVANHHMGQATEKEEFSDWPQSLLAIGTFGISNLKADADADAERETLEEEEEEVCDQELVNRDMMSSTLPRSISRSLGRSDILLVDQNQTKNNVIRKKSLTFLLRKLFACKNRFNHAPLVADSLHPTIDKSRMEKMLRAILNKKIHPQSSSAKVVMPQKKYLVGEQDISMDESDDEEIYEAVDDYEESNIWVNTDSEYIVLEI